MHSDNRQLTMELEQSSDEQKQQPSTGETERDNGSEGKRSSGSTATAHTPSPSDGAPNSDSESLSIHPIFYYASIFLLIATLFQVISTTNEDAGPFDWFAGLFIPHFLSLGIDSGSTAGDDFAVAGGGPICPPDQWVDESFVTKKHTIMPKGHSSIYSPEYDPRSKETKPTLFPHCALKRWVQMKPSTKHSTCPSGQSYVTAIYPPTTTSSSSNQSNEANNKIPKIIHISSPTNCIPTSTIQTLSTLSQSTHYTIYIHSHVAMDNFLFNREYKSFPQIKEGILCGMKKLEGVSVRALQELKVGNSTEQRTHVATEIGLGVKRDFWRLMILWEYGGVTLDIDTLHDILVEGGDATNFTATRGGETTMRNLIKQWSMEKSDGMIYFINNVGKQRLPYNERIPSLDVMVWKPHHAFIFYSAKIALRFAVFDTDKPITDTGRTTRIQSVKDALQHVNRGWKRISTGDILTVQNTNKDTIHFVDGDAILPPTLSSPRTTPWKSILKEIHSSNTAEMPEVEPLSKMMRHFAGEQIYIGPKTVFSCMEYTLDMYLQKTTKK